MRRRSVALTTVGTVLVGLALLSVIQLYPRDPCGGADCGIRLFGLLPELIAVLLGGIFLAAGTFEWTTNHGQAVRLLWYPGWGLLSGGSIGGYVTVFGPSAPAFFWLPVIVGGTVGVTREVWSWDNRSA